MRRILSVFTVAGSHLHAFAHFRELGAVYVESGSPLTVGRLTKPVKTSNPSRSDPRRSTNTQSVQETRRGEKVTMRATAASHIEASDFVRDCKPSWLSRRRSKASNRTPILGVANAIALAGTLMLFGCMGEEKIADAGANGGPALTPVLAVQRLKLQRPPPLNN